MARCSLLGGSSSATLCLLLLPAPPLAAESRTFTWLPLAPPPKARLTCPAVSPVLSLAFLRDFASLPEPFPPFSFPFFPSNSLHLPRSLSLSAFYHYLLRSTLTGAPPPTPVQPSAAAQLHPLHATALPIHWPEHPPIPCGTRLGFIQGGGGAWAGQKPEGEGGRRQCPQWPGNGAAPSGTSSLSRGASVGSPQLGWRCYRPQKGPSYSFQTESNPAL